MPIAIIKGPIHFCGYYEQKSSFCLILANLCIINVTLTTDGLDLKAIKPSVQQYGRKRRNLVKMFQLILV